MEFFAEVKNPDLGIEELKNRLTINRLPALCRSVSTVITDNYDKGIIYCVWGEFEINREELKYGIRFSLPRCPNALSCSFTLDEKNDIIVIHCAINKKQHDEDFIDSIHPFVDGWAEGLQAA